jgi:SagB-type dehydrogenase family enzyme
MPRGSGQDIGALFYSSSTNVRARPPDLEVDWDRRPRPYRTYAGALRTPLSGRDFRIDMSLGAALEGRRSIREFRPGALDAEVVGRLLHASAGVCGERLVEGRWMHERPFPSGGGLYPIELYVVTRSVEGIDDAIYHYDPRAHELELRRSGCFGAALADSTIGQDLLRDANLVVALSAIAERSTWKYGERGHRYVWLEAGHIAENLYLAATGLRLGAAAIGGFFDTEIDALLALPSGEKSLYLVAIGQPR